MKHKLHKKLVALQMIAITSLLSISQVFAMTGFDEVTTAGNTGQSTVNIEVTADSEEDPTLFSAYIPATLPIKVDKDGNVHTPSNAAIVNGVATKGIAVTNIQANLDNNWQAENWNTDFSALPENSKYVGLKLRGDTLSNDGSFSLTSNNWRIPKNSYIDLNMDAKLPPQSVNQKSDAAVLSFTLDWSGDDTSTGPKWDNSSNNPDDTSGIRVRSDNILITGGSSTLNITWDSEDGTVSLASVTSSNEAIATVGSMTGEEGNKTVSVNGLRYGKSNIIVTLSNGKSTSYVLKVYDIGDTNNIKMELTNKNLRAGDTVRANDINISVPVISPDGETDYVTLHPQMDDVVLADGANELPAKLLLGGSLYDLTMTINV